MSNDHTHSGHDHSHAGSRIGVAFFLNLAFTIVELVGGALTNSVAILSDAVHDLGDSLSLALAWYFEKLSKKGRTPHYTYGYKRFSLLGAIINSIVLVVGSLYILSEAIPRLFAPEPTSAKGMFALAILGIVVNGIAVLRTRGRRSINERVVSLHLLEDVLGWAAVLVGAGVMWLTGWTIIDPLLSIGVACFVLLNVYKNIRQTLPILLQGMPSQVVQGDIEQMLRRFSEVAGVHDLHIWSLDESYHILTAHLVLCQEPTADEASALKRRLREALKAQGIQHATLELELSDEGCECNL